MSTDQSEAYYLPRYTLEPGRHQNRNDPVEFPLRLNLHGTVIHINEWDE